MASEPLATQPVPWDTVSVVVAPVDQPASPRVSIVTVDLSAVLDSDRGGLLCARPWQLVLKRGIDVVLGSALLVLSLVPILLACVAIRVTSPGPAIYRQTRVGRGGRTFAMLKLRTMVCDADDQRRELGDRNDVAGPVFKLRQDPRVTPLGRLLRRWSIDELPQLINVIRGQMSLVGPRPPLVSEVAEYTPADRTRLLVVPGITGIWQVSGRADVPFERWMELDRRYLRDWTLRLDLVLLVRTVGAVVRRVGAY